VNILWLAPYPPEAPPHGGRIRLGHLIAGALSAGHRVELLCLEDGEGPGEPAVNLDAERFSIKRFASHARSGPTEKLRAAANPLPEAARLVRSADIARFIDGLKPGRFDLAVLEQAHMGAYLPALHRANLPVVLDAQNIESWLSRQLGQHAARRRARLRLAVDARKFARLEGRIFADADSVVATSVPDRDRILAVSPRQRVEVVSSGVDVEQFAWSDHTEPTERRLLMTGTLGYPPNLDAALWTHEEIMPRIGELVPGADLSLVGHSPPAELSRLDDPGSGFRVVGRVDDVVPYMEAADVFVIPLRMGSGTRLKAVEALASGLPLVSTSIGVEGLGLEEGRDVLIGDDAEAFARCVHRALTDPELRRRLSIEGRRTAERRFDWRDLGARFAGVLAAAARG